MPLFGPSCFLSSLSVIISSFLSSCILWIICNLPVYLAPACWVSFCLVYSFLSVFLCLPCLVYIKDCLFEFTPRLRVPRSSLLCAPWHFPCMRHNSKYICVPQKKSNTNMFGMIYGWAEYCKWWLHFNVWVNYCFKGSKCDLFLIFSFSYSQICHYLLLLQ